MAERLAPAKVTIAATELQIVVVPFLLLGAVLTVSVFGAIFGVPLLAASWWVWRSGRQARKNPDNGVAARRLRIASASFGSVLTLVLTELLVVGANDLDSFIDVGALALALVWVTAAWHSCVTAFRARGPASA